MALEYAIKEYNLQTNGSRISDWLNPCDDDDIDDLCNYIVGCGKEYYFECLENPQFVKNYLTRFRENFAYCFID